MKKISERERDKSIKKKELGKNFFLKRRWGMSRDQQVVAREKKIK